MTSNNSLEILIVDDSKISRMFIARAVGLAGFDDKHIHEAENGKVALDFVLSNPVDIVFLDLNMPVMDGEEFLRHIRASEGLADLPVILVSAQCSGARLRKLNGLGVGDALPKPVEPETLRDRVLAALGESS